MISEQSFNPIDGAICCGSFLVCSLRIPRVASVPVGQLVYPIKTCKIDKQKGSSGVTVVSFLMPKSAIIKRKGGFTLGKERKKV